MNVTQIRSSERRHRLCASAIKTTLPLFVAAGLLGAALASADRAGDRAAMAGEVDSISVRPGTPEQQVSLRDRLVVGLQARLKSEIAFVEEVVHLVETGKLPQRLVDETYFWARTRAATPRVGRPRRPIIYFQAALTIRARHIGVAL